MNKEINCCCLKEITRANMHPVTPSEIYEQDTNLVLKITDEEIQMEII